MKAPSSEGAPVTSLSGGNQQKVVIGRALMGRPRVLLLDEPTRGVDVGAKAEIIQRMNRLADDGLAVVFASSELDEVMTAATRGHCHVPRPDYRRVRREGRVAGCARSRRIGRSSFSERGARWARLRARPAPGWPKAARRRVRPGSSCSCACGQSLPCVLLVAVFSMLTPEFLTTGNLTILIKHVAINAILAIGMTFVILSGGIDLSVGSIAGLAGMVSGALISNGTDSQTNGQHRLFPHLAGCSNRHLRRGGKWRRQWGADRAPSRAPIHRHPWHVVRGAGRGDAHVGRGHVSKPGRTPGAWQYRLHLPRRWIPPQRAHSHLDHGGVGGGGYIPHPPDSVWTACLCDRRQRAGGPARWSARDAGEVLSSRYSREAAPRWSA